MSEARDVRLYIYAGTSKGEGLSLTESQTFKLDNRENAYTEEKESVDSTGVKTKTQTTTTTTFSYEVTLTKLEYRKKVYEPCQILANLQVGVVQERTDVKTVVTTTYTDGKTGTDTTIDKGHFKPVEMVGNDQINLIKGKTVELEIDNNTIAKNYYVHKVRSVYKTVSGKTSLFVELTIFSRDKLMTLDKYSRAYTAKRLYTDILAEEAKNFSSVQVANHMQLLKYCDSQTGKTARDELRIPYIVQYNESFYDFMVRAANRYGEFLYFEDGKLNLGMQPSEANYFKTGSDGQVVIDWATEPNAVQNRYYESVVSEEVKVNERAYDYMTHDQHGDEDIPYASTSSERYNIDAVPMDDWTKQSLSKSDVISGYVTQADLWQEELKTHVVSFVCRCLGATTFSNFLVNLVYDLALEAWTIFNKCKSFNNIIDEHTYDPIENDDQKSSSGEQFSQFATYSGSMHLKDNMTDFTKSVISNFTEYFYQTVRKKEKDVGEQAVWLDFGNYYKPIKLGDRLCIDKKDYVAIQVEGSYQNGQEHLLVSAIPVEELPDSTTSSSSTSSSTTSSSTASTDTGTNEDTWTNVLPFPPALPGMTVRDARPQVAFVAEVLDPEVLGRIRVRYPWQSEDGDMSPWIRVTLPLATSGGAVNFTPSVGDEVMVGYVHGNIDRPYAMGYVPAPFMNSLWGDSMPFDEWGGQHGIKVKTGHHLVFTDGANAASFTADLIGGPFSWVKSIWPLAWLPWPLNEPEASDLGGGFELSDRYGIYKISGSTDERKVTIESPMGTVEMNAFQGISISAPNGDIKIEGKNVSISANNKLEITSGNTIKDRFYYKKEWAMSKKKSIVTSFLMGGLDSVKELGEEKFLDFGFIRCLVEVFLRPVNGTLQIKSYTFVQVEAGTGGTEIPSESLRKDNDSSVDDQAVESLQKINRTLSLINMNVRSLVEPIKEAYNKFETATAAFKLMIGDNGINKEEKAIKFEDIISYAVGAQGNTALPDNKYDFENTAQVLDLKNEDLTFTEAAPDKANYNNDENDPDYIKEKKAWEIRRDNALNAIIKKNADREGKRRQIKDASESIRRLSRALSEAVGKWDNFNLNLNNYVEGDVDKTDIEGKIKALDFFDGVFTDLNKAALKGATYDKEKIAPISDMIWNQQITAFTRYVAYQYVDSKKGTTPNVLYKLGNTTFSSAKDTLVNKNWVSFVKSVKDNEEATLGQRFKSSAKEWGREKFVDLFTDNYRTWKHGFQGKILFSETGGKTASFDDNYSLKTKLNENAKSANLSALDGQLAKM